jgi:hypothetical protein
VHLATVAPGHQSACTRVQQGSLQLREQAPAEMAAARIDEAFTDVAAEVHLHSLANGAAPVLD